MDRDLDLLTALLLDPFLTTTEAEREAAATPRRAVSVTTRRAAEERRSAGPGSHRPTPMLDF